MSVMCRLSRPAFWRRAGGFFLLFLLLAWNREAAAQNYLLRYVNTASGAVTFTGNTLGLAKLTGVNQPGALDSIGTFITLNTNLQVGTYPPGTTLNWSNNSSAAVLRIPTNSTVLYAELVWAGSAQITTDTSAAGDVLSDLNTAVKFILPDGSTNSIAPDPVTASLATNGTSAIFYVCSANVTALVQGAGAGTYAAGGVPGTVLASEDANNACGWTLAVVYGNASLHQRNLSLFVGNSFAISGGTPPNPAAVTGFCAPPTGVVNGRLFVSAVEGDPNKTGDQMLFGPTTNSLQQLFGPNNLVNNFFAGQINGDNGLLDTSGTFGLSNSVPPNVAFSARQGWDITSVDVSSGLTNGITSAYAQNITQGDGYSVNALALQIDVGSPVLSTAQTVDKASTFVGDTLTYTVTVTNSGTSDAMNLVFTDPLPFGTSFIPNTFMTNGVVITGANPVNGVFIPLIKQNSSYVITYQVLVDQIPPTAKFITAATIDFQYAGACAQSPIINGTLVNALVQTFVPLLSVSKVASLTNVIPGAAMTYTINVPNVGTTNTTGTTLLDPLPAGVSYVTNTTTLNGTGVPDIGGTNMPYTVASEIHGPGRPAGVINVGDTAVVTFQVKISATPPIRINNSATIFADGLNPTTALTAAANVSPVFSDLAVGIAGSPNPAAAGAPISYTVSVTNEGPDSLNVITNFITLYLPLSSSILSPVYTPSSGAYNPLTGVWSGITLASNGVVTLTISGQVSPDTIASNIISSVTVTPPPGVIDLVTNNNSAAATNSVVQVADLAVTISDGVTNVYRGDALTYTITAINLGPSALNSISVSNSFSTFLTNLIFAPSAGNFNPANGAWNGLALAPGDSVTLAVHATVRTNVSGAFTNSSTVTVPPGVTDPVLANNAASDVDIVQTTPDVAVTGSGPTNVLAGGTIVYTVTVTNLSPLTASNVVVSDSLPPGVGFVSATGGGTTNNVGVTWPNMPVLTSGAAFTFTVTVTAPTVGTLTNIVSGVTSTIDPVPGNNNGSDPSAITITAVTPVADVAVGKSGPAADFLGANFSYTISVTNFGPSTAAALSVTDNLPAGLAFASALPATTTVAGNQVVWTNLNGLAANAVTNLTLSVTVSARGIFTNFASAGSTAFDPNSANNLSAPVITAVTNRPPAAADDSASTSENVAVTIPVLANDSDPDGDALTIIAVSPTNGVANIVGTNIVFTPTTNFTGTAYVLYSITDGQGATNSALVTISVTNRPPVANPDFYSVSENSTNTLSPLTNDVVVTPGGSLTLIGVSPTNGSATISGTNVIFVPTTNFLGTATIGYTITDGVGGTNFGLVTVSVTNRPPIAVNDSAATAINTAVTIPVLANDSDPDGNPLSIVSVSPTNGIANIAGTNVVFTPATNFVGTGYVLYRITDGNGGTNSALVTITVTNTVPTANAQSVTTTENTAQPITLTGSDPNSQQLTYLIVISPAHGTLTLLNTNTGAVTYTPGTNYSGADSFTFRVNNGQMNSASATVSISILAAAGADVQVILSGPTNATVGDGFFYTTVVTNAGPLTAVNTLVTNVLPPNLVFDSASGGGVFSNGVVTWPVFSSLTNGQATNLTVTVTAASGSSTNSPTSNPFNFIETNTTPAAGFLTNRASAFAATFDPDLTNNSASAFYTNAQAQTLIVPGVFSVFIATNTYPTNAIATNTIIPIGPDLFIVGTSAFNPQTQLYEEFVSVTNVGQTVVHALRLYVGGLRSGVTLMNATGTSNGIPYVEYDPPYISPLYPGNGVTFALEFFVADRHPFTNSLSVVAVLAPATAPANGTPVMIIQSGFNDQRNPGNPRFLVEFTSIPGRTYTIEYSDDHMATWNIALPSIVASAISTFWYDDGPPETVSPPAYPNPSRFYRVLLNP